MPMVEHEQPRREESSASPTSLRGRFLQSEFEVLRPMELK